MSIKLTTEVRTNLISISLFFILIATTYWVYAPGIKGSFIFDDMYNISPIGKYTQLSFWDNFWLFLLEGHSGPTGRPLSLASFYLNDVAWPSTPSGFIYTNILIHLLNGILIFWLSRKLTSYLLLSKTQQAVLPLLATALWLLHPMHTTTVLYIIQRMTELSATFIITGLLSYLYGREKLATHKITGLLLLFIGVGFSLLLSILSKENGILLVAYILVVEFFLLQPLTSPPPKYFFYWLIPVVILPFIFMIVYLGNHAFQSESFVQRNFNLTERILTESRIIFDYIQKILIPDMSSSSLFHDDLIVSKSLLSPWTTILSIIGILSLVFISFITRKKWPILAFSIAWFLAGHLLESTVLALELYFEHRNYLPMFGILFLVAWGGVKLIDKYRTSVIIIQGLIIFLFSFLVMQNSILWGKPIELSVNWYNAHPNSQRTREMYISMLEKVGLKEEIKIVQQKKVNESSLFIASTTLSDLARNCLAEEVSEELLNSSLNKLKDKTIHSSAVYGLTDFITYWRNGHCQNLSSQSVESFLAKLSGFKGTKDSQSFASHLHYWLSEIYREKHDFNKTMEHLDKAYSYVPTSELLKLRVAYLSSAGLYEEAIKVLNNTELLEKSFRARIVLRIKKDELDQLRETVKNLMNKNS